MGLLMHQQDDDIENTVDVVVVGAGLAGMAFARFYLETRRYCRSPDAGPKLSHRRSLELQDVKALVETTGGYTRGLLPLRQTCWGDAPIQLPADAPVSHDTFGAKYVSQYLEEYVDSHFYQSKSLRDRIWLNSKVLAVNKSGETWTLKISSTRTNDMRYVNCTKLVFANGITSLPNMPPVFTSDDCPMEAIHHRDFGAAVGTMCNPASEYNNVTVIGGGKSAADMAYAAAKAGKAVNWLVRKTGGEGPGLFLDPPARFPYRNIIEQGNTVNEMTLTPSAFGPPGWHVAQFHKSEKGLTLLKRSLLAVDQHCKDYADYEGREGALPGFKNLRPEASWFWQTRPVGLVQQADFWEVISKSVRVFRADISYVTKNDIYFRDGKYRLLRHRLEHIMPIPDPKQIRGFGLPHDTSEDTEPELWNDLMQEADEAILRDYPLLANPPLLLKRSLLTDMTPARLYRAIAPLSDDSVVFLGRPRVANNFRVSEAQAIWATAYFDGHIEKVSLEEKRRDIAHHNMFSRRRYPSRGGGGLNLYTDLIWYTDTLARDVGLVSHRKDWWYDWSAPLMASDFKGCREEYLAKYGMH